MESVFLIRDIAVLERVSFARATIRHDYSFISATLEIRPLTASCSTTSSVCLCMCVCTCMFVRVLVFTCMLMCVSMFVCLHVCLCMCVCMRVCNRRQEAQSLP